jgi:Zn-dependent protease
MHPLLPDDRAKAWRLRVARVPVFVHWSFPAVGLGLGLPIGCAALWWAAGDAGFAVALFAWSLVAVAALVVVHEAGHAVVARWLSLEVHGVVFTAGGGCCVAERAESPAHELAYSAAGVAGQCVLLAASAGVLLFAQPWSPGAATPHWHDGAAVFTAVNGLLIGFNGWPARGSDGQRMLAAALAWRRSRVAAASPPATAAPALMRVTAAPSSRRRVTPAPPCRSARRRDKPAAAGRRAGARGG